MIVLAFYAVVATLAAAKLYFDLQQSQDRLLAAWRDGAIIPERVPIPDEPEPEEVSIEEEFPKDLAEWLNQWEEPLARQKWRLKARALLKKHHGDVTTTILELDEPAWT